MPRLSIVLVAHREQGFLGPCLTSILGQRTEGLDSLEVVVVDDASPDHSPEVLAEIAAADDRVHVIRLDPRRGPGPARSAGLAEATGDHVWVVDPTDLLPDGALEMVAERLAAEGPDVLVVAHRVLEVDGAERDVPVPAGGATPYVWDKVVRADLARAHPAPLRSAGSVAVLDQAAYVRRALPDAVRRRSGSYEPVPAAPPAVGSAPAPHPARRLARKARGTARRTLRQARSPRRLATTARRWPLRAWYRLQLRAPIERDLVVYGAYWYAAYSCNPRAIYEKAREIAPWLDGVWVVDPDKVDVLPDRVRHVVAGTRDYYRVMARAKYLVNNVNFPNDIVKRAGQVHLQTHHGTPLKTMGLDLVRSPYSRKRMNFHRLMKRVARWDYSVSQNAFTTIQWERAYPGTYESLETGYPRNDVLANATADDVARVRAELGIRPEQTTILYTPTHREYHEGYVPQLDPEALADKLGPDHVVMVRAHYFYGSAKQAAAVAKDGWAGRVLDVASHPRIEDLCLAADLLITDYSSLMFDYAVLDRPIVAYVPDWDDYRTLRGTYFDLLATPPGAVARTEAELAEVLVTRRAWDDESTAYRRAFRDRFCSLEDGRASERVVRRLWPAPPGGHA